MNSDVKLTLTQEDSHDNREGGEEREDDSEIAEVNKDSNDMQCTEDMTRKFTNLSFISNTTSSQCSIIEESASHSVSALSGTTLNEEVVIGKECLKLRSTTCEDYKKMYDECERELAEHKETFHSDLVIVVCGCHT